MDYSILNVPQKDYKNMLPAHMVELAKEGRLLTYGATEGKKIAGAAFFSDIETEPGKVELQYIYTDGPFRRKGVATNLLKNAATLFKSRGARSINGYTYGSPSEVMPTYRFLLKNRFVPVISTARLLTYYVSDLADTKFVDTLMRSEGALKPVEHIEDFKDPRLRVALSRIRQFIGYLPGEKDYDSRFFGVLLQGGDVKGTVLVNELDKSLAFTKGPLFMDNMAIDREDYPSLLADAIGNVKRHMAEDVKLSLMVEDDEKYNVLLSVLGPGESDCLIQKYIRVL